MPGKHSRGCSLVKLSSGAYAGWRHSFNRKVPRTHEHRHETGLILLALRGR